MPNSAISFNTSGLATTTSPGLVGTGAQTFAGDKTFNGNIGIGTSSPAGKLDVAGTIFSQIFVTKIGSLAASHTVTAAASQAWVVHAENSPNSTGASLYYVKFDAAGTGYVYTIAGNGGTQITVGTNQFSIVPGNTQTNVRYSAIRIA